MNYPLNKYFFLSLVVLSFVFLWACRQASSFNSISWDQIELKEGDIVFRRGSSLASRVVLASDGQGNYSHIGIIVREGNAFRVVHAVPGESGADQPDRLKMERLNEFFAPRRAVSGKVMRLEMSDSLRFCVASKARDYFDSKTLFDHHYDLTDSAELYCTELIWQVFRSVGIDITANSRSYVNFLWYQGDFIFPSDISRNDNLISIYSFINH